MKAIQIDWNRSPHSYLKEFPKVNLRDTEYPYSWIGIPNLRAEFSSHHILLYGPYKQLRTELPEYEEAKKRITEAFGEPMIEEPISWPIMFPDHTRCCWRTNNKEIRLFIDDHCMNSIQVMAIQIVHIDKIGWSGGWKPHNQKTEQVGAGQRR